MAGKATSVYLSVVRQEDHKTVLYRQFFNMGEVHKFKALEKTKQDYPQPQFYFSVEIY